MNTISTRIVADSALQWFGDDTSYSAYKDTLKRMQTADLRQLAAAHNIRMWDDDDEDTDDIEYGSDEEFGGDYAYMLNKHGDIAVMEVYGSLVSKESWWNRYFGMVSYEEIRNAAIAAHESGAKALLIDFDTGGGAVSGIGECSDFLMQFSDNVMPVYSYTGANMLSAGYWLGAVGKKVFSSTMALSGSIGVVSAHFSYYRQLKEAGIDVTMFRQGEFKALGSPYEQLDEKAKAEIEGRMKQFYDMFLGHVSLHRRMDIPTLIKTAAEGRVFMGEDSRKVGLVDAIASFDKAIELVTKEVGNRKVSINSLTTQSMNAGNIDMKRKLNQAGIAAVASGMDKALALTDPALSVEAQAENPEQTDEAKAKAKAEGEQQDAVEEEGNKEEASDKQKKDKSEPAADASMLDRLVDMSAKLATAEAEIKQLKAADQARDGHFKSLLKIAADSTNRMELPLNRAQTNLKDASAETVINAYHATLSEFNSRFKVGGVAETAGEDNLGKNAEAKAPAALDPKLASF